MDDHDLVSLLDAALRVGDAQEGVWLDCRCPRGSILSYSAAGTLAKAIIGMANRDAESARAWNDGVGLVVVGMEKGKAPGAQRVPRDRLAEALRPYLGEDPPAWHPRWVAFRGVELLVVEVPAAGPGSAIHCLNKEYDKEARAAIYVRHPGLTALATPTELLRLTERARGRSLRGIEVALRTGMVHRLDLSQESAREWLAAEQARLLAPLDLLPREQEAPAGGAVARFRNGRERLSRQLSAGDTATKRGESTSRPEAAGSQEVPESRTASDYRREVEQYISQCAQEMSTATRAGAKWLAPLTLSIVNTTDEFWSQVELIVELPHDTWAVRPGTCSAPQAYPVDPQRVGLPAAPRLFGPSLGLLGPSRGTVASQAPGAPATGDSLATRNAPAGPVIDLVGSGQVRFPAADLRPGATWKCDPIVLGTGDAGPVTVQWRATGEVRGVLEGSIALPVADPTWTPVALIAPARA